MRDPYLYPNTEILINKHNIKDEKNISEMEAEYVSLRLKQIAESPLLGNYDFQHFCEFHRWIFQDMYEWAGAPRTINIEKAEPALGGISIEYTEFGEIESITTQVLEKMKSINWSKLTLEENSAYVRTSLVAASAIFKDLGDKSKPEYLIRIVRDSLEKDMSKTE